MNHHLSESSILVSLISCCVLAAASVSLPSSETSERVADEWNAIHRVVYEENPEAVLDPDETLSYLHQLVNLNHNPQEERFASDLINLSNFDISKCNTESFVKIESTIQEFSEPKKYPNIVQYLLKSWYSQYKNCTKKIENLITNIIKDNALAKHYLDDLIGGITNNGSNNKWLESLVGEHFSKLTQKGHLLASLVKFMRSKVFLDPYYDESDFDDDYQRVLGNPCANVAERFKHALELLDRKPSYVKVHLDEDVMRWLLGARVCRLLNQERNKIMEGLYASLF